jgi:hypothetical protein
MYFSEPAVRHGSVNILIQVPGPMLPKAGPESKMSKKASATPPRRLAKGTSIFVV